MDKSRYISDKSLRYAFSMTLKELRQKKKYTHQQIADQINVERTTYTYWENGKRLPPINMVFRLCDLFEMPTSEFFDLLKKYKTEKEKENEEC